MDEYLPFLGFNTATNSVHTNYDHVFSVNNKSSFKAATATLVACQRFRTSSEQEMILLATSLDEFAKQWLLVWWRDRCF